MTARIWETRREHNFEDPYYCWCGPSLEYISAHGAIEVWRHIFDDRPDKLDDLMEQIVIACFIDDARAAGEPEDPPGPPRDE